MKKLNKKGGFTLVEMLIVVAIIAILIAISIPIVNSALEKARDATDQANERAAKAEAAILILDQKGDYAYSNVTNAAKYEDLTGEKGAYYDAKNGVLLNETGKSSIEVYGRHTATCSNPYGQIDGTGDGESKTPVTHENKIIKITYAEATGYKIEWVS